MMETEKKKTREDEFVEYVFAKLAQKDAGYAAKMRRADNRATEDYAWELLAPWAKLDRENERLPYAIVGAAVCREKTEKDGELGIGKALAKCCEDNRDQGAARMRRLLACDTIPEVCKVLRPMLGFIQSNKPGALSYSLLLNELRSFGGRGSERVRQRWAMDFYDNVPPDAKAGKQ